MAAEVSFAVRIFNLAQSKETAGLVRVQQWDAADRKKRAARFWLFCWAGAMGAVILPLVHFVLVPSLLLAGPIGAFLVLGQQDVILGGKGTCPDCGAALDIARASVKFPLSDVCGSCHSGLKIERVQNI